MGQPIDVDLPHKLGKDEAKRRIGGNIHKLSEHVPGGAADVTSRWEGDTMKLSVSALGQAVEADITVYDSKVHCHIDLPGMLALFAKPIEAMLSARGGDLLLEDKRD